MGCDGGTIPKRHELVKTAKRPEQKDKDMDRKAKWSTCTISQQSLASPIVTCELGKLYNKESVLEFLLDRSICETASHIRNLKDVKTLNLTPNPGYDKKASGTANEYYDTQTSKFVCPVVGIEMNGKYKFYALWTCGCVMSERAFKEVESETCHSCGTKFGKEDIIILNPEGDDFEAMEKSMKERREKVRKLKKEKKEKKGGREKRKLESDGDIKSTDISGTTTSKKSKTVVKAKSIEDKDSEKGKDQQSNKDSKKIDVTQSKVYKSLFTSSEKKKDKDNQAHWITYNPYHL